MREIKLIHAADMHLDSAFEALPPEQAQARRIGQRQLLKSIALLAEDKNADAILLSGDIFENDRASDEAKEAFIKAFGSVKIPVFVAPGNHDPYTPSSIWARMALPENIHIFKSEDFECVELPGLRVWGAGFESVFAPSLLEKFPLARKSEDFDGFEVMVLHGDFCSGDSDYNAVTKKQIADSKMDYMALGHIHTHSEISFEGKTGFSYCGCPEGRGYDETGKMGVNFVSLTDTGVSCAFVALGGARYDILTINVSENDPISAISEQIVDYSDKDYLRIFLTGECDASPDMAEIRRIFEPRLAQLQLRDETTQKRDLWSQAGQDSLAGLFLQKLQAKLHAATDENEKKKIELAAYYGLAAMEGGAVK